MATLTATPADTGSQPRAIHAGANVARGVYSLSADIANGDVLQMVKVPNGAVIDDVVIARTSETGLVVGWVCGDGDDTDRFIRSAITSLTADAGGALSRLDSPVGLGYRYNFSDAVVQPEDTVDIVISSVSGGGSLGHITCEVTFHLDEAAD